VNDPADQVRELVARQLGVPDVSLSDRLVEDLDADSMDLVTVVAVLEESYGIRIDEERLPLLRTVADLAGEIARGPEAG
jgi:acyl carrier protein